MPPSTRKRRRSVAADAAPPDAVPEELAVVKRRRKTASSDMPPPLSDTALIECLLASNSLSASTKKTYECRLHTLATMGPGAGSDTAVFQLITTPEASGEEILASDKSLRTKHALVNTILSTYKHMACASHPQMALAHAQWDALSRKLGKEVDEIAKASVRTEKEDAGWASWSEWLAAEARLAREDFGSVPHLLVAMLCLMPPVRGGDMGIVYVVKPSDPRATDDVTNVLIWRGSAAKPAEMLIKTHKTQWKYGALHRPLPPSLRKVVAASLRKNPRDALFVGADSEPFNNENTFVKFANKEFNKIFGKRVTVNIARHAFCSSLNVQKLSTEQREAIATLMGHSLQMQESYRRLEEAEAVPIVTSGGEYVLPMISE